MSDQRGEFDPFVYEGPTAFVQPHHVAEPVAPAEVPVAEVPGTAVPADGTGIQEAVVFDQEAYEDHGDVDVAPVARERRGRKIVGALVLGALGIAAAVGIVKAAEGNDHSGDGNTLVDANAPVVDKFEQGDHPCGRTITKQELVDFYNANPNGVPTNPTEANAYFGEHPNLKNGMTGFFDHHYTGMLDWVNANKDKTDPSLKDKDGDRLGNFENRLQVLKLDRDFTAVNNRCNPDTGEITAIGAQTFKAGDFVYGFTFDSKDELKKFEKETGLSADELLLTTANVEDADGNVHELPFAITNRGLCDNPLYPPMHFETTITTGGSTTVVTVTSTIPSTTTSEVTTTTGPTTTLPHSGPKQNPHAPGGAPNDHVEAPQGPDTPPTTVLHQGGGSGGTSTTLKAPGTTAKPPETTNPPSTAPTVVSTTAPDRGTPDENKIP